MCGDELIVEGDVRGVERPECGGVREKGAALQCTGAGHGGHVEQGTRERVPGDVDGDRGSGDLVEGGAAATEVVAGAPGRGQRAWHEDLEAHEEERCAGDAVSDLREESDTPGIIVSECIPM